MITSTCYYSNPDFLNRKSVYTGKDRFVKHFIIREITMQSAEFHCHTIFSKNFLNHLVDLVATAA